MSDLPPLVGEGGFNSHTLTTLAPEASVSAVPPLARTFPGGKRKDIRARPGFTTGGGDNRAIMGVARSIEQRLEGLVEGLFTKLFRSGLQPVEVGRRILREMARPFP